MNDDQVVQLTRLLSAAVKFSDVTQREIERKLGMSSGTLSRLFSGGIELKMKHVVDICAAINFPARCFFLAAFPKPDLKQEPRVTQLQRLLEQLHPGMLGEQLQPEPTPEPTTQADVDRMVMTAMGRYFAALGSSPSSTGAQQ